MNTTTAAAGQTMTALSAFFVAPCLNTPDQITLTTPEAAELWTIYGVSVTGAPLPIHDAQTVQEVAAKMQELAAAALPMFYCDATRPPVGHATLADLVDALAELIHDEIPGYDDPADFRDDDFDAHPLAELREAIQELTDPAPLDAAQRHAAEQWQVTLDWENRLFLD